MKEKQTGLGKHAFMLKFVRNIKRAAISQVVIMIKQSSFSYWIFVRRANWKAIVCGRVVCDAHATKGIRQLPGLVQ